MNEEKFVNYHMSIWKYHLHYNVLCSFLVIMIIVARTIFFQIVAHQSLSAISFISIPISRILLYSSLRLIDIFSMISPLPPSSLIFPTLYAKFTSLLATLFLFLLTLLMFLLYLPFNMFISLLQLVVHSHASVFHPLNADFHFPSSLSSSIDRSIAAQDFINRASYESY